MRKLLVALLGLFLVSCASLPPKYAEILMIEPTKTQTNKFEDDKITISFSIIGEFGTYGSGFGTKQTTVYKGIDFVLTNKTDKTINLDWNKVSFIINNMSGNTVMHKGIKYNDCNSPKAPSVVMAKSHFSDTIIPCFGVEWVNLGKYGASWKVSMLPPPQTTPQVDFGVFLPLQFEGGETINYKFIFKASGLQAQ